MGRHQDTHGPWVGEAAWGARGALPTPQSRPVGTLRAMRALRRGLVVLFVAVIAGGLMKLRGKGGVPPTSGGWRELEAPDFR